MSGKFQQQGYCYLGYSNNFYLSENIFVTPQKIEDNNKENGSIASVSVQCSLFLCTSVCACAHTHTHMQDPWPEKSSFLCVHKEMRILSSEPLEDEKLFLADNQLILSEQIWQSPFPWFFLFILFTLTQGGLLGRVRGPSNEMKVNFSGPAAKQC